MKSCKTYPTIVLDVNLPDALNATFLLLFWYLHLGASEKGLVLQAFFHSSSHSLTTPHAHKFSLKLGHFFTDEQHNMAATKCTFFLAFWDIASLELETCSSIYYYCMSVSPKLQKYFSYFWWVTASRGLTSYHWSWGQQAQDYTNK